jgi:hypothetical protein
MEYSFLCVDSKGKHDTGAAVAWKNRITIKSRTYQDGSTKMVELRAAPDAPLRYTTTGSDPKTSGGLYSGPFAVPAGTICVLAIAEKAGVLSEIHRRDITWDTREELKFDLNNPVVWRREHRPKTTKESYELLGLLKKHQASLPGPQVKIVGRNWLELNFDTKLVLDGETLETAVNHLREILTEGQVAVEAEAIHFATGQRLLDWVRDVKTEIKAEEVKQ